MQSGSNTPTPPKLGRGIGLPSGVDLLFVSLPARGQHGLCACGVEASTGDTLFRKARYVKTVNGRQARRPSVPLSIATDCAGLGVG